MGLDSWRREDRKQTATTVAGKKVARNTMLRDLKRTPGVGPKIARELWSLGFRSVADLKDQSPEEMYARLCTREGKQVDRCVLYVFRCAVYFASNEKHDPALLKWWAWKDPQ